MLTTLIIILTVFILAAINSNVFQISVSTEEFEENHTVEAFYFGEGFKRIIVKGSKAELKAMDVKLYQVVDGVTVAY